MNHQERKQQILDEAQERGLSTKDLKVLSTDPYMVGSDGDYEIGAWASKKWDEMMAQRGKPIHIRGFHYWLFSVKAIKPDGNIYATCDNPMSDWKWLQHACQVARYLEIGNWNNLRDQKHPDPRDYDGYYGEENLGLHGDLDVSVADEIRDRMNDLVDNLINQLGYLAPSFSTNGYQAYHTEVWCEKSSMGTVIDPICQRYGAVYQALTGQASVEKVTMAMRRCVMAAEAGEKVRIFYIADWDRYGWSMVSAVARKLEFMMVTNGIEADVKLARLALNEEHIKKYNLPKAPKKGESVVELDALDAIYPGELGKIIKEALAPYRDTKNPRTVQTENNRMRDDFMALLQERVRPHLEAVLAGLEIEEVDLSPREVIDEGFECPERDHVADESGNGWVYNSDLDWFAQLDLFKKYKSDREEEEA